MQKLSTFLRNTSGNFAMTLALVAMPLMLGIGAAFDYANISREQSRLQGALDAGILAIGVDFPSMSNAQIQKNIKDYMKSNLTQTEYDQLTNIVVQPDLQGRFLSATAKGKYSTSFMMLAGIDKVTYEAQAQIKAASGGAEIIFVLDNTGSMTLENKMDDLKAAATDFTNAMMTKSSGGDIKIGIVPFSNHVNVGMSNRNASWIDVPADSTTTEDNYCYMKSDVVAGSCTTQTGTNSEGQSYSYQQCSYGDPYEVCGPRTVSETWYGCVGSREEPYNLEDRSYGPRPVPGLMNVSCSSEITPLTDIRSTVLSDISAMNASGSTYIPAGLTWGLRALSDGAPFSQGVSKLTAKNKDIKKYLILMTDGDNTQSAQLPGSAKHWGNDVNQANEWTSDVCDLIKDEDIIVYSITFGTVLPATADLVRDCASDPTKYFHAATGGTNLTDTFTKIRESIMALHLSK